MNLKTVLTVGLMSLKLVTVKANMRAQFHKEEQKFIRIFFLIFSNMEHTVCDHNRIRIVYLELVSFDTMDS